MAGASTAAFFFLSGYFGLDLRPYDLHEGMLGLMVHIPVLVGVSLLTQPQSDEQWDAFASSTA